MPDLDVPRHSAPDRSLDALPGRAAPDPEAPSTRPATSVRGLLDAGFDAAYDLPGQPSRGERVLEDVQNEAATFGDVWTLRALAEARFGPTVNAAANDALVAALGTAPGREAVLHALKGGALTPGRGADLVVLFDREAVLGLGHTAVMIGNDYSGWRLYSKDGARGPNPAAGPAEWTNSDGPNQTTGERFASFKTLDAFFRETVISDKYEAAVRIEFEGGPDRGADARAAAEAVLDEDYDVIQSSCAHVVEAALEAAGVPGFSMTMTRAAFSRGDTTPTLVEVDRTSIVPRAQFRNAQRLEGADDVKSHAQIDWELRSRNSEPQ